MRFALLLLLAALPGCSEHVNVSVNCKTTAEPAVECVATQTQGKTEVEACWDFELTCANGAVVKATNVCAKVKDGGTANAKVTADKLTGLDKCQGDKPPTGKLANMTLNGKPAEL